MNRRTELVSLLLVEDDDIAAEAIQRALRKKGVEHPVIRAHDGVEALEILRGESTTRLKQPYIVVTDLNMPRMNGLELLTNLRKDPALSSSVVFMLTTSQQKKDRTDAWSQHVTGYILKDQSDSGIEELIGFLQNYWDRVELPE